MSLESVLKNLIDAINANTEAFKQAASAPSAKMLEDVINAPPAPEKPTAPPAPEKPAAPPAPAITPEELNTILVSEFARLNNDRTGIDAVLKEFGVNGVSELPADKFQDLIDKVKAL